MYSRGHSIIYSIYPLKYYSLFFILTFYFIMFILYITSGKHLKLRKNKKLFLLFKKSLNFIKKSLSNISAQIAINLNIIIEF